MGIFNKVSVPKPKTSLFNLSHERKMSGKFGYLYPCFLQEVIPGDGFQVQTECFLRFAPMIAPIMHRINVDIHYFFVPNRIVWDNWDTFITGDWDGLDSSTIPQIAITNSNKDRVGKGLLSDYLGFALDQTPTYTGTLNMNYLPWRVYHQIFNDYYADLNLQNQTVFLKGDSASEFAQLRYLKRRAWEKDYFTSALPWSQRGASVNINATATQDTTPLIRRSSDGIAQANAVLGSDAGAVMYDSSGAAQVYLDQLTGITMDVDDLRYGMRLQSWYERNARAGSRLTEVLASHFGVKSDDARLQRAEYLGGGRTPVSISEVLNTSESASDPQGNMAGHGISVGNTNQFRKYFKEHGYVMGILSVIPKRTYSQGVPKHFLYEDKFDYYWPTFNHIGEQAVVDAEVYLGTGAVDLSNSVLTEFGYQQRYAHLKSRFDEIAGDFRDTHDHWHAGEIFASKPSLNDSFISCDPTAESRIFAVSSSDDYLYIQLYHNFRAIRPMPYFSDPRL